MGRNFKSIVCLQYNILWYRTIYRYGWAPREFVLWFPGINVRNHIFILCQKNYGELQPPEPPPPPPPPPHFYATIISWNWTGLYPNIAHKLHIPLRIKLQKDLFEYFIVFYPGNFFDFLVLMQIFHCMLIKSYEFVTRHG